MNVRTILRSAADDLPGEDAIRARRVELSRRNSNLTEDEETALVAHGRVLVHAETDEMFTHYRGPGFSPAWVSGIRWARLDSNQGPTDYESAALTS